MDLRLFKQDDLFNATLTFFRDTIGLQLQTKSRMPVDLESQFEARGIKSKKVEEVWSHVDNAYYIGLLDDDNFENEIAEQEESDLQEDLEDVKESDDEYPGILIFAVDLSEEFNPTRSNLTEINRTLNRFSQRVPALVLTRYGNKVSLMLADRVAYKQEWREGEKVRKVSLLRDIDLDDPHAGHLRILKDLVVPTSGTKKVESFDELYEYWKEVLDTSELNKKFYQDLSNWYFWAIDHVKFPSEPSPEDAHVAGKDHKEMIQEHRATNVIRLLTRLLFVWFIKEKGLIPEELFELTSLQKDILNDISPYHEEGLLKEANKESIYYKAILQNLFFATLNCPIEASSTDNRERGFRRPKGNFGVTYLMRYEEYFKDKDAFLELVNNKVPFLNGGLFECLDERGAKEDREDRIWIDGFSDNLPKEHALEVPDFLFFGVEEHVDLSEDYGLKSKKYKEAAVRGLLNIFNSYKFTITENTPIEEDVALDPELLGKVFENLLASYNPETKTTARKQTGSFYTPREIVNYMVDESLIAYLKNSVEGWGIQEEELDNKLHQLTSYEETVPFEGNEELHRVIITALSNCTILDPACGSGAFPMGILQKMVHILQKLDTDNEVWKEVQKEKASKEADRAISEIEDKEERGQRLKEINEAFDERMNAPDYARKLFLIENCIYGVDIQPVATQISKLRFFISLVVEQKVGDDKSDNFGIRPLPNLETKFVTANTLIDIKDNSNQTSLYETDKIKKLETELKGVRSKLFSARTTDTKYKYRQEDERLRNEIAEELKQTGWPNDAADKLASWDPYDQNSSSPFFNPEWMFDISEGFNILIGNPPWGADLSKDEKKLLKKRYPRIDSSTPNSFAYFIGEAFRDAKGVISYVLPDSILIKDFSKTRELIKDSLIEIYWYLNTGIPDDNKPFVYVEHDVCTLLINKQKETDVCSIKKLNYNFEKKENEFEHYSLQKNEFIRKEHEFSFNLKVSKREIDLYKKISDLDQLSTILQCHEGIHTGNSRDILFFQEKKGDSFKKLFHGSRAGDEIQNYKSKTSGWYVDYRKEVYKNVKGKYASLRDERIFKYPKIYITRTGNPITAFYDKDTYASNNFFSLQFKDYTKNNEERLKTILPLILSKFSNYYIRTFAAPRLGDTYVETKIFHILKIPYRESMIDNPILKQLTDIMIFKISRDEEYGVFQDVVDALILNFYFSKEIEQLNIDIKEDLNKDLSSCIEESDFEGLSIQKKEKAVELLQARWSDPQNEVRKRINSFPEKSPDILKPILEG